MEADVRQRSKKAPRHLMEPVNPLCTQVKNRSTMPGRILNMSPEGVFVVQNGRVKECNHFLATQTGYAMEEIAGTCFASFFDRESIPAVEAACGEIALGRGMISLPHAVLVCKDGKSLEVRLKACACRFGGKPAVRVTLIALGKQAVDDSWDADLDGFFVSEETPLPLPQHI